MKWYQVQIGERTIQYAQVTEAQYNALLAALVVHHLDVTKSGWMHQAKIGRATDMQWPWHVTVNAAASASLKKSGFVTEHIAHTRGIIVKPTQLALTAYARDATLRTRVDERVAALNKISRESHEQSTG